MPKNTARKSLFSLMIRCAAAGVLLLAVPATQAGAADYPQRNVRFIIPFSAGGGADVLLRILANALADHWGHPTTVENRVGGNTVVGTIAAIGSPNDGYTLLFAGDQSITINPAMMTNLPYTVQKDLVPITLVAKNPMLLVVTNSTPAKNLKEFIALAKAKPEGITFGSSGAGSTPHLSAELFQYMTGIKLVHVPYKGSGAGMVALLSGEISMYFANIPVAIQHVRNGRLRPVALSGTRRNPAVPGIPTLSESGLVGFDVTSWFGIAAPAKTPRAIVDQLNGAIVRAVNTPDLRARFLDQGAEPVGNSPEQYTAFIEREIAKWAKVIKAAGIKAQ